MSRIKKNKRGWAFVANSRKAHYFDNDIRCLCGNYGFYGGELEDNNHQSSSNCKTCMRKREKLIDKNTERKSHE